MRKYLILIICFVMAQQTIGLSQILRFEEVTRLSSSINSDAEESIPFVSNNGKTMYFVRSFYKGNRGGLFGGQDIWVSTKEDSIWAKASNQHGVLNNKKNNVIIGLGNDDITLYLLDSYGGTVHGIAFSRLINNKWTKPEKIQIKGLAKEGYLGFYMNPSFDILLISMKKPDSYGKEDLYVSLKDSSNRWSDPRNLGATINSSGYEISPFLSKGNDFLFFASDGPPGFGDADIFVSERLYDSWDVWSVPKNLGPIINSAKFDAYFTLTADSTVYFSSNRSSAQADLYRSQILDQEHDISQAKIDSLIKEAEAIINELKTINPRSRQEILLLFEYSSFDLSQKDKKTINSILQSISNLEDLTIELEVFSGEGYSPASELLLSNKRTKTISEYLIAKGLDALDISIRGYSVSKDFDKFKNDNIGAVKITFKL